MPHKKAPGRTPAKPGTGSRTGAPTVPDGTSAAQSGSVSKELSELRAKLADLEQRKAADREKTRIRVAEWRKRQKNRTT